MKITDHLAQAHNLPKGGTLKGHKIVVEGSYFASEIDPHNGHFEKKVKRYREEFILEPGAHKAHGQGALGHILSDRLLIERLSSKDKNFRAIQTHTVVEHENIIEKAAPQE